jgi:hypothetical protein
MARKKPGKTDKKNAETPEVEDRQSRIAVFFEKIGEKDKDQNGNSHGFDEIKNLIGQRGESFCPVKAGHIKHNPADQDDDDEEWQMLTPGRNLLRDIEKSGFESQQISQEPGQGNKAKVNDNQEGNHHLIVSF